MAVWLRITSIPSAFSECGSRSCIENSAGSESICLWGERILNLAMCMQSDCQKRAQLSWGVCVCVALPCTSFSSVVYLPVRRTLLVFRHACNLYITFQVLSG